MSLEVIKSISDAEDAAREARLSAQTQAKSMIAEAEKKGQAAVLDAAARAEDEVKKRFSEAEQKAAAYAAELQKTTAEKQAEIRRHAESRLNDAAGMIIERIVNG
jgi:V/A-type H+-transporting ATPase subunit G/H